MFAPPTWSPVVRSASYVATSVCKYSAWPTCTVPARMLWLAALGCPLCQFSPSFINLVRALWCPLTFLLPLQFRFLSLVRVRRFLLCRVRLFVVLLRCPRVPHIEVLIPILL